MADLKITELGAASTLDGSELVEAVQGGVNVKTTTGDIAALGGGGGTWGTIGGTLSSQTDLQTALNAKQDTLVSGTNIKTINSTSILGSGDISISGSVSDGDKGDITVSSSGTVWTIDNNVVDNAKLAAAVKPIGVQDIFISAAAMWARVTNGCAQLARTEMTTSLFNIQTLDFDQTTQEFAQFQIVLPRKYNNGTVTFRAYWTAASGSGTVQWGLSGGSYRDDDALTVAFGTAQTSDDTLIATNDLHISPESSAITLAGTVADGNLIGFQISRNVASDTLSADAKLLGISLRITVDAAADA